MAKGDVARGLRVVLVVARVVRGVVWPRRVDDVVVVVDVVVVGIETASAASKGFSSW